MAFQQPTIQRRNTYQTQTAQSSHSAPLQQHQTSESQEWILFSPGSQAESSTQRTDITQTAGLSRASELGYLNSDARSLQPGSSVLDDDATEDAELDSLDDGLHAFREPALYTTGTHQTNGPLLPAHDGLGSFQASSAPVLEQLWQHEQYNTKRKHEGHHRRPSSVQRHLDTIDEFEAQANEEKRLRIEKWRIEQSQALIEEVEKETRRRTRSSSSYQTNIETSVDDIFGTTPKQSDYISPSQSKAAPAQEEPDNEPFWRRITRKFIRDIIGIDEPLLSVILGESLPGEATPRPSSPAPEATTTQPKDQEEDSLPDTTWRDNLLRRIAHELGVFPSQLTPHPGPFTSYTPYALDYAGMPVATPQRPAASQTQSDPIIPTASITPTLASSLGPNFPPTLRDDLHAESWGFEEEPSSLSADSSLNLRKEREYWERELDVKMVFRYLRDRFSSQQGEQPRSQQSQAQTQAFHKDSSAQRTAIIRQHHPLVNRAHRSPVRLRRDSRLSVRRPSSSCASESLKESRKASALRSGSSRNYWDIGGSVGSGSVIASGGMWGQA
ncbi:hypothetical protein PMZ80_001013 [Knufia obscura]|uniref:Uncharacterized protein n=2 Tax=Knufia TaxID=430999 RepID=A0AAN8I1X5_9EURO|nr:hypothetical protein PMZ80_001013 [Knufia obscura]KAK5950192.1 hypothetical protein OHC33_008660 [Knufia fluminis]